MSIAVRASLAAWTAWVILRQSEAVAGWRGLGAGLAQLRLADLGWTGLPAAAAHHASLVVIAVLIGLASAGTGRAVAALRRGPRVAGAERTALELLAGFLALGTAFLGLGLAGLFFPGVLVGVAVVGLLWPGGIRIRIPRVTPPGWAYVLLVPAALTAVLMLVPSVYVDVYGYHLAAPAWFLRVHRFALGGAPFGFQVPLSAELVDAFAVMTGRDALAHWIHLIPFGAAAVLLAGLAREAAGPAAGWLALAGIATLGLTLQQAVVAKNSLAAAAYPAAAAACAVRGLWGSETRGDRGGWLTWAALLFGGGAAMKWSGFPYLAVGAAGVGIVLVRRRKPDAWAAAGWLALAGLPILPWLAKSWLCMGDPLYPFLSRWIPGALWDEASARAMASFRRDAWTATSVAGLGADFARFWRPNHAAVAIALPLVAVAGGLGPSGRWLAGFAGVAWIALWGFFPGEAPRLGLAAWWILAVVAAAGAVRVTAGWSRRARQAALAGAAVSGWLAFGANVTDFVSPAAAVRYLTGSVGQDGYLDLTLSTYREAAQALRSLPRVGCVIALGEERSYRLPGRVVSGRFYGRNPAWSLARECRTRGDLRRKFRQLDCRHVLYNLVTECFPHAYAEPFAWDDRMLALWRGFVGRDLEVAVPPVHLDHENGAFCVYALRDRALARDPEYLPYLPGIESLYFGVTKFGQLGDPAGWTRAALALNARLPGVDYVGDIVGSGYAIVRRWSEAYPYFVPGIRHGTVDDQNWWYMGLAAGALGRFDESYRCLVRAVEISPYLAPSADEAFAELRRVAEYDTRFR